jgi:hypothetical protein
VLVDEARAVATLLVEFDPMLALEVRDHLAAKADEWDRPRARRLESPGQWNRAWRYRELAQLIDALGPMRGLRD